jgi:hypothetical protein
MNRPLLFAEPVNARKRAFRDHLPTFLTALPALAISAWGAYLLANWVVDDAAISYCYARNAASGNGLVTQAGRSAVEGFSNPLWVMLLAVASVIPGADFHSVIKGQSWLLVSVYVLAASRSVASRGAPLFVSSLIIAAVALQPPLLIWSNGGLEGPLVFSALVVLAQSLIGVTNDNPRASSFAVSRAAVAASCCTLARPEGIAFALGGLAVLATADRRPYALSRTRECARYAAVAGLTPLAYVIFRRSYFGEWLPNTFYAKGGVSAERTLDALTLSPHAVKKVLDIGQAVGGHYGATLTLILLLTLLAVAYRGDAVSTSSRTYLSLTAVSFAVYVLLPGDWMGEHRYAASAVLLLWMSAAHLAVDSMTSNALPARWVKVALPFAGAALFVASGLWVHRILAFRDSPTLPVAEVIERAKLFETAAQSLGIARASVLTQDAGGFLLEDQMEFYDIGLLTDRRLARALGEWRTDVDQDSARDYVFEDVKPDFISVTAYHAWVVRLDRDRRLDRDYLSVNATTDKWILERHGVTVPSGDYVRRERVPSVDALRQLQAILANSRGPINAEQSAHFL